MEFENINKSEFNISGSKEFVGRDDLIEEFKGKLERIKRQGPVQSNLQEFYGGPGIGKTSLIRAFAKEVQNSGGSQVQFNFEQEVKIFDLPGFWQKVIYDLRDQNPGLDITDFDEKLNNFRNHQGIDFVREYEKMDQETRLFKRPKWLEDYRGLVISAIKTVNELPEKIGLENGVKPIVFSFDQTDNIYANVAGHIEEWMINPLTQIKHCLFVWVANRPWRWKRPEIRTRLESEELKTFNHEEISKQIEISSKYPDLVKRFLKGIDHISCGHPLSNSIIIKDLDNLIASKGGNLTNDEFVELSPKLLENVHQKFIERYILNPLESKEVKTAIKYLSLVRIFDTTVAEKVLNSTSADIFKSFSLEDYGDLLLHLKKTSLLVWEKGYSVSDTVRKIIQKHILVTDREAFIAGNEAALGVYKEWLKRPLSNRNLFIVEELYHTAILNLVKPEKKKYLSSLFKRRLKELKEKTKDKRDLFDSVEGLEKLLRNDDELDFFTSRKPEILDILVNFQKGILK